MKSLIKVYLLLLLIIISCDKEGRIIPIDTELPPITTTGENTFGCLMNGEVWTPYIPLSLFPPGAPKLSAIYNEKSGEFELRARRTIPDKNILQDLFLFNDSIFNLGHYTFRSNENTFSDVMTFFHDDYANSHFYLCNNVTNELEIINYDTTNRIMSGMFSITLIETSNKDTLFLTNGRFDVKY